MGKFFSNRNEFTLVAVGKGQQHNLVSPNILKPNQHGGQKNITGLEATGYRLIGVNLGTLLKFSDKMFMKQKMTKIENKNQMSDKQL